MRRCVPAVVGAAAAVLLTASPAVADNPDPDSVVVDPSAFGWVLTKVTDSGSAEVKPERPSAGPARVCRQTKSENAGGYAIEAQLESGAYPDAGPGGWVVRRCSDGVLDTAWVPARRNTMTPAQLAARATNRLRLPLPVPQFEPRRQSSAGPATLVAIPTWFYLDGWAPVTQRTRAGGVWAEVTAAPVSATWWPGDGSAPVRCVGPGRAWTSVDPAAGMPCRYTYRRSSAGQPGSAFPARVSVVWQVTWRGAGGLSGSLPLMERQSTFPVAVAERQTVVTVGGVS